MHVLVPQIDRCIVCLGNDDRNIEHVIPESLGGRLKAQVLCTSCNSSFGHSLVVTALEDPGVVIAITDLKDKLPRLHQSITRNLRYFAPGPDGAPIEIRDEKLRTRKMPDGTLLMGTEIAATHLESLLIERGVPKEDVKEAIEHFKQLDDGVEHELVAGLSVRKSTIANPKADLSSSLLDERWPALVALEFLTLNAAPLVLADACDGLRAFVRDGSPSDDFIIERFFDGSYEPRHAMYWRASDDISAAHDFYLRLFGGIVFCVRMRNFGLMGPLAAYVEELETGKSVLSQNGLAGPFQVMNP